MAKASLLVSVSLEPQHLRHAYLPLLRTSQRDGSLSHPLISLPHSDAILTTTNKLHVFCIVIFLSKSDLRFKLPVALPALVFGSFRACREEVP